VRIVGLPSRLVIGPEYHFGLEDTFATDAEVVDKLVTVDMLDASGEVFSSERTRQRERELFFVFLELSDPSKTATVVATYVEERVDGSRCTRRVDKKVTGYRHIYFPSRCDEAVYRPSNVIVACGDGGIRLSGIRWRHWDRAAATGSAAMTANTCDPSCAEGEAARFKVSVRAYRIRRCEDTGRYQYTRLRIRFVGRKW